MVKPDSTPNPSTRDDQGEGRQVRQGAAPAMASAAVRSVSPALADYTDEILFGEVWQRAALRRRDRSFVTVSALVAGGHTAQMVSHFKRALDFGMTPQELAEVIFHLAFYTGWPRAMSAVGVAKSTFEERGLTSGQTGRETAPAVPAGGTAAPARSPGISDQVGAVAPALADYTSAILFGEVWRRRDLNPRDRSLATIVALICLGQVDQLADHLAQGMENGLTAPEAAEVLNHLAFYAGWPRAMSAIPVLQQVLASRRPRNPAPVAGSAARDCA